MKEFRTKLLLMAAVAATSLVMHTLYTRYQQRRVKHNRMLQDIAEEGYETAGDILYPNQGGGRMQYGPVLPNS